MSPTFVLADSDEEITGLSTSVAGEFVDVLARLDGGKLTTFHPAEVEAFRQVELLVEIDDEPAPDAGTAEAIDALSGTQLDAAIAAAGIDASRGGSLADGALSAAEKRDALKAALPTTTEEQ